MSQVVRKLFDTREAAGMLGVSTKTLRAIVAAGDIRSVLIGKRNRKFKQSDIDDFIEARRQCHFTARKTQRSGTTISKFEVFDFAARHAQATKAKLDPSKRG